MSATITSKPTDRQVEALRTGARDTHGVVQASAGKRTHEGLVARGLADWTLSEDIYESDTMWGKTLCVINKTGRDYLATLDAVEITREDVEEGKRQALAWLGFGERRREAEQAPASVVLAGEFTRIRRVMRRAMRNAGAEAANNALNQYNRTEALLNAARRFDQEDAAAPVAPWAVAGVRARCLAGKGKIIDRFVQKSGTETVTFVPDGARHGDALAIDVRSTNLLPLCVRCDTVGDDSMPHRETAAGHLCGFCAATIDDEEKTMTEPTTPAAPRTEEYEGITRADVAADVAAFLAGQPEEYREAFAQEPAIVTLSAAFRQAQRAWCADKRERTADETAAYNRAAHVVTAAIIFTREDEGETAVRDAVAQVRLTEAVQRAQEDAERTELHRRALAAEWAHAEAYQGGYQVRTEDAGHGLVRVFVKGPATEVDKIDRASLAYARSHGLREGGAAGGGEFFEGEYIAQRAYNRA